MGQGAYLLKRRNTLSWFLEVHKKLNVSRTIFSLLELSANINRLELVVYALEEFMWYLFRIVLGTEPVGALAVVHLINYKRDQLNP